MRIPLCPSLLKNAPAPIALSFFLGFVTPSSSFAAPPDLFEQHYQMMMSALNACDIPRVQALLKTPYIVLNQARGRDTFLSIALQKCIPAGLVLEAAGERLDLVQTVTGGALESELHVNWMALAKASVPPNSVYEDSLLKLWDVAMNTYDLPEGAIWKVWEPSSRARRAPKITHYFTMFGALGSCYENDELSRKIVFRLMCGYGSDKVVRLLTEESPVTPGTTVLSIYKQLSERGKCIGTYRDLHYVAEGNVVCPQLKAK